ncbi:thioredoxin domain-containing protein [Tenacibaculum amylolyticum]|uniref:thioredoxin domain-containing protein n=1 Tax=Tenacibaculum amylolyticum TaxID=104269 RepID=UPI0038957529
MRYIKFIFFLTIVTYSFFSCSQKKKEKFTNELIHETSPYLLQHAHNPVNWVPWDAKYLEKAKKENKLVLVSIGYSSCHWCHVMEKETFENEEVAQYMNEHFINIKIDREEHPDVDKTYMTAVQIMTGNGGWPLNCIILPNGKPVWGGTYFPKNEWLASLKGIQKFYTENPTDTDNFAERLSQDIQSLQTVIKNPNEITFSAEKAKEMINIWKKKFDTINGGLIGSNQFPRPNNYLLLLRYAYQTKNKELQNFITLTLNKMALGGLNDHLEGGFARYTVDNKWHIPHFEKMLYDNAQLVSLFSYGYQTTNNSLYKDVVYKTLDFIEKEFYTNGLYFSSLNADSYNETKELEEGAYYTWTKDELTALIQQDIDLFNDYFGIGITEKVEGKHALVKMYKDSIFIKKHHISLPTLHQKLNIWKASLLEARTKREKPELDTKILTSWNALLLKAFTDAYKVFGEEKFKNKAIEMAKQLKKNAISNNWEVYRSIGKSNRKINGYLEDYALLSNAYISLYQITLNEKWLTYAKELTAYSITHFLDDEQGYFKYTTKKDAALIATNFEFEDVVIPSSNSVMSKNLLYLGHYYGNNTYLEMSKNMLHNLQPKIEKYPQAYSNWFDNYLDFALPYYETVISGKEAVIETKKLFTETYIPNMLVSGSTTKSDLPLLQHRFNEDKTLIYVCVNKACKLPTESITVAAELMGY